MNLYVVRHGDALSDLADPARPLSPGGREELDKLANCLVSHLQASVILHSGKTRAQESAQILQAVALPNASVQMRPGLSPNDPVDQMAEELQHAAQDLVIVGHLPYVLSLIHI